jgi:L-histidine Nalpha-methyltransferase
MTTVTTDAITVRDIDSDSEPRADAAHLRAALRDYPRRIPSYFGYDARGSELFEQVTTLPTYYLTSTERVLLASCAAEISGLANCSCVAELGSGSAKKTRLLLEACVADRPTTFMPIDVSREMLVSSGEAFASALPGLRVEALWGRYGPALRWLASHREEPCLLAFLGSTFGNMLAPERDELTASIAAALRPGDRFLVTADLRKPREVLEQAYNDPPASRTFADFRLNRLAHLNRLFDGDFAQERYYERAHFDEHTCNIEAHVYASEPQHVTLRGLDLELDLERGDSMIVDVAHKFSRPQLVSNLEARGLEAEGEWIDGVRQYGVFLFARS